MLKTANKRVILKHTDDTVVIGINLLWRFNN